MTALIAGGMLDGVLEQDKYVSNIMLSRKTIQYHVTIDFTTLLSQLKNKGIILQSIECPSCSSKLDYPEAGTVLKCKYCGASVSATDVFEKFKGLLGL